MLSDYPKIINILKESATANVMQAEETIRKLAIDNVQMLACLQNSLRDLELQQNLKQMAACYINSIIIENKADYPANQIFFFMKAFLTDPTISIKNKRACERSIKEVLQLLEDEQLQYWVELAIDCKKSPYDNVWLCCCLLLQCFATSDVNSIALYEMISKLFEETFGIFIREQLNPQQMISYGQFIKSWAIVFDKLYILRQEEEEQQDEVFQILMKMCNSQIFCQGLWKILEYASSQNQYYLCLEFQLKDNLEQLNQLKYEATDLLYKTLSYICKYTKKTKILEKATSSLNEIFQTISISALGENVCQIYSCEDFMIQMLKVLNLLLGMYPSMIKESWKLFLLNAIYPLLKITDEENSAFIYDSKNFIDIADDCCEDHMFETLKSQACKALEIIVDNSHRISDSEEVVSFILNGALLSIKVHLGMLLNVNEQPVFTTETAFLVLSIFSYQLTDHLEIVQDLRIILCDQRIKNLSSLEQSRLLLFLSYGYFDIFRNPSDGYHWVEYALIQKQPQTLNSCSIDFLFNISDQYYTDSILIEILKKMPTNSDPGFFNLLQRLLSKQMKRIPRKLLTQTIEQCLKKIEAEFNMIGKQQIIETLIIVKCLHVLRIIAEKQISSKNDELKNTLWKVTVFLGTALKYQIADEIIKIVSEFVKHSIVPFDPPIRNILSFITENFKAGSYLQTPYYIVLNNYIMKQDPSVIQIIFQTVKEGLAFHTSDLGENPMKVKRKVAMSHLLLLLQNIIALFGNSMKKEQFYGIKQLCLRLFPKNQKKIYDKVLLARSLNLIFLCHMHNYQIQIIDLLLQYHDMKIYFNYDIKVLVGCIKVQIFKEPQIVTVVEYLNILARIISLYLKHKDDLIKKKKSERKQSKEKQLLYQKYLDYEVILGFITTPFSQTGDYPIELNEILKKLKDNNFEMYHAMIDSMTTDVKEKLTSICSLQSTETEEKRKKLKIIGIKNETMEENVEEQEKNQRSLEINFSEEEEMQFRAQRKELKKRRKRD